MTPLLLLSLFAPGADAPGAAEWPQFLGPTRDSVTPAVIKPWSAPPKVLWKAPVGDSHASPVVAGGVVYAFFQPPKKDEDALAAFDAATGKKLWEKSYARENFTPPFGKGPRSTPAVEGGKVYTLGNTGILAAWDAKTGEVAWKVDTLAEFNAKNLFFGVSTSPTVLGGNVVVMVGGKDAGIVAFHTATGKKTWAVSSDPASYATPAVDRDNLVFLTGANVVSVSKTGSVNWQVPFKDKLNESWTTPVILGDRVLASSVTAGSVLLKGAEGKAEKVWAKKVLTCYFSTPVSANGHVFMVNGAATLLDPAVTLRCVDPKTGNVAWTKEKVGRYHAALVRTGDGKLLMLDDNGGLALLEPDTGEYKELARSKVCGPTSARPAVVGNRVYLRDEKELICLEF